MRRGGRWCHELPLQTDSTGYSHPFEQPSPSSRVFSTSSRSFSTSIDLDLDTLDVDLDISQTLLDTVEYSKSHVELPPFPITDLLAHVPIQTSTITNLPRTLISPSMTELESIRDVLVAIPSAQLRVPGMPMAVALQEAHDLHAALATGDTWSRLLAVGIDPEARSALGVAVAAARQAQSQWVMLRDRRRRGQWRSREAAARRLRSELLAACRWNLEGDAQAIAMLDRLSQGSGASHLVKDLRVLGGLVERHARAFEGDASFDPRAQAEAARSLVAELEAACAEDSHPWDQRKARRLRDRAFTHLSTEVAALREAGRYAFRHEPERAAAFASEHRRARARKRRRVLARARANPGRVRVGSSHDDRSALDASTTGR